MPISDFPTRLACETVAWPNVPPYETINTAAVRIEITDDGCTVKEVPIEYREQFFDQAR